MGYFREKIFPSTVSADKEYWSIRNHWVAQYKEPDTSTDEFGKDILLSELSLQEKLYENSTAVLPLCTNHHNITGKIYNIHNCALADVTKSIYRAFAVSRSVVRDMSSFQFTYSEISSYIASLFFAKAITLMLGIWISPERIVTTQSKTEKDLYWAIDFFRKNESKGEYNLYLINLEKKQTGHANFWDIFFTLVQNVKFEKGKGAFFSKLKKSNIDPKKIPYIRNKIQYSYGYWGDDDLVDDLDLDLDWFENNLDSKEKLNIQFNDMKTHPNKIFLMELMSITVGFYEDIAVFDSLIKHKKNFENQKNKYLDWNKS